MAGICNVRMIIELHAWLETVCEIPSFSRRAVEDPDAFSSPLGFNGSRNIRDSF